MKANKKLVKFVKDLKALSKKKMSQRAIAKKLKVSRSKVYYWLHK